MSKIKAATIYKIMGTTTHSIEVNAPLQAVYNQWTQFEEFPRFMEGVDEVRTKSGKMVPRVFFGKPRSAGKTNNGRPKSLSRFLIKRSRGKA
jgi:Polyketide cyclase / dehydrase and lipid transport